jgi:hypothetical protein
MGERAAHAARTCLGSSFSFNYAAHLFFGRHHTHMGLFDSTFLLITQNTSRAAGRTTLEIDICIARVFARDFGDVSCWTCGTLEKVSGIRFSAKPRIDEMTKVSCRALTFALHYYVHSRCLITVPTDTIVTALGPKNASPVHGKHRIIPKPNSFESLQNLKNLEKFYISSTTTINFQPSPVPTIKTMLLVRPAAFSSSLEGNSSL